MIAHTTQHPCETKRAQKELDDKKNRELGATAQSTVKKRLANVLPWQDGVVGKVARCQS